MSYPFNKTHSREPFVKNSEQEDFQVEYNPEKDDADELDYFAYRDIIETMGAMSDTEFSHWLSQHQTTVLADPLFGQIIDSFNDELSQLAWKLVHQPHSKPTIALPPPLLPTNIPLTTPEEWFQHLNGLLAVVMNKGGLMIPYPEYSEALQRTEIILGKRLDLIHFFTHKKINNGSKMVGAFEYWFSHPDRNCYSSLQFAPGITVPEHVYNLWQGFAFTPSALGSWTLLKDHIRNNIAGGNPEIYSYILDWMADVVQLHPDKPGVALVLIGKKGVGKGIFANNFGKLLGRHFVQLTHSKQLTGQFNSHMQDVLLAFADEAFWGGDKQAESNLKGLITESHLLIEPKFVNAFTVRSYTRLIIASNNDWVVPTSEDERRYLVLHVNDESKGDKAYFKAIQEQLEHGGYEAMLNELQHRDLSQSNLRHAPRTQGLSQQTYLSDPVLQYLIHCFNESSLYSINDQPQPWGEGLVLTRTFLNNFDLFSKRLGKTHGLTENTFGKALRRWLCEHDDENKTSNNDCIKHTKTRKNLESAIEKPTQQTCYLFKSIDHCKAMIEKKLGTTWNWKNYDLMDDEPEE